MPLNTAAIYDALWDRLKAKVRAQYHTRNWVTPADLTSVGRMPALEYAVAGWRNDSAQNLPPKVYLDASVVLYVAKNSAQDATATLLDLTGQVEEALQAQPGEKGDSAHTTLGGLVRHAWVTRVEIQEGDVSGQAAAQISVSMLAVN